MIDIKNVNIAIIGVGYVGLPLAREFRKYFNVVAFDTDFKRVERLTTEEAAGKDDKEILKNKNLIFTNNQDKILEANCYIVTVPTPVTPSNEPDLTFLKAACETVGSALKEDDVVIFESTVYPGTTEEFCIPILENTSRLKCKSEFSRVNCNGGGFDCGYSPERINPGDTDRNLADIIKITSGNSKKSAKFIDQLYSKIITAGTFSVASIKIAEAAKIIENTQRDLNIALINELSLLFKRLGVDTESVLKAAETKWNFQKFRPGLVGGHCIGVDPYYLTYKAKQVGFHPQLILAGRAVNDSMGSNIATEIVQALGQRSALSDNIKVLILGVSFKENCPDVRNSKVIDIYNQLKKFGCQIDVYDPVVDPQQVKYEHNIDLISKIPEGTYDAIAICVSHDVFVNMEISDIKRFGKLNSLIYDVKYVFNPEDSDLRL
jgi:UDP-N-acetyl-D-galactosamine dehydrogenase